MNRALMLILLVILQTVNLPGRAFTVLVYNVENLFDVDGEALFADYEQGQGKAYGIEPMLQKLEGIRQVLSHINAQDGPEIILFQELELDRTPEGTPDAEAFLEATRDKPLAELLETEPWARNLPSDLLLLKYLNDNGLTGYTIAQADSARMKVHPAHKNVIFSKFPIVEVRQRPLLNARDLLIAEVDIDGHRLILLNNHWKSGASNPELEPVRVENAQVVRNELDAILAKNPLADVIIAGDLNSYYNHKAAFPDLAQTGVNDVLKANGFEDRMTVDGSRNLYNLWFELEPEDRGSEVYRGYWGTLMQMILTPGLYDQAGIQYIDNSFNRLAIPGLNVESRWSRPRRWNAYGGGSGFSDHLPILARFRTVEGDAECKWMHLEAPTSEELDGYRPVVDFGYLGCDEKPPLSRLEDYSSSRLKDAIGKVFAIDQRLSGSHPAMVRLGDLELQVYSPLRELRDKLDSMQEGDRLRGFAEFDVYRGKPQIVIRDAGWMKDW